MSYLREEGARAINPSFERSYTKARGVEREKVRPIEEAEAETFRAAMELFGVDTGKKLGLILHKEGLLTGKDEGARQGQNLYKKPQKINHRQYTAIFRHCKELVDRSDYELSLGYDEYDRRLSIIEREEIRCAVEGEEAPDLTPEKNELKKLGDSLEKFQQLTMRRRKALGFLESKDLDMQAGMELELRALVDGARLLDPGHRHALLEVLLGMLSAQGFMYSAPGETSAFLGGRAQAVAAAIGDALSSSTVYGNNERALANLVRGGEFSDLVSKSPRNTVKDTGWYVDESLSDDAWIAERTVIRAVLDEYVSPRTGKQDAEIV